MDKHEEGRRRRSNKPFVSLTCKGKEGTIFFTVVASKKEKGNEKEAEMTKKHTPSVPLRFTGISPAGTNRLLTTAFFFQWNSLFSTQIHQNSLSFSFRPPYRKKYCECCSRLWPLWSSPPPLSFLLSLLLQREGQRFPLSYKSGDTQKGGINEYEAFIHRVIINMFPNLNSNMA